MLNDNKDLSHQVFEGASISYKVINLANNEILKEYNSNILLAPASTQKIITTSIALDELGSNFKFYSNLILDGNINEGVLVGNLIFKPNSNPALCNERWGNSLKSLTDEINGFLNEHKIQKIEGKFIILDSLKNCQTLPRTWIYEDIGNYFGANPSGTMINENKLELFFYSQAIGTKTDIISTNPSTNLTIDNQVVAHSSSSDLAYAFGSPGSSNIKVTGGIPSNRKNFKVTAALPNPIEVLKEYLEKKLSAFGFDSIEVVEDYNYSNSAKLLVKKIHQIDIKDVVYETNQKSVNILAEVLKQNVEKNGDLISVFQKYYPNEVKPVFFDGSGLSRFNAVSTNNLIDVLIKQKGNNSFVESLSVGGVSGTLKNMFAKSECSGKVIAKSGYMEGVRSYAGYINTKTNKKLGFAIIVNNYSGDKMIVKSELKKWIEDLYQLKIK